MQKVIFVGVLAAILSLAGISAVQGAKAGPLTVHQLTSTIYWVEGGVGNCGFIVGNKGVIVIDTTVSPTSGKALLDHIAEITPKPVTTVILTHGDMDHIGGLAAFPTGITIIAQAKHPKADGRRRGSRSGQGLPGTSPQSGCQHEPGKCRDRRRKARIAPLGAGTYRW